MQIPALDRGRAPGEAPVPNRDSGAGADRSNPEQRGPCAERAWAAQRAAGLFATLASESAWLRMLRLAETPAGASAAIRLLGGPPILGPLSMVTLLASGIAMMVMSWGHQAWIVVAFAGIVAMGALGGAVTGRRVRKLRTALEAGNGSEVLDAFRAGRSMAALSASLRIRIAIGIGVVALMTAKPASYATSLLVLAAAALGGGLASLGRAGRSAPVMQRRTA